MFLHNTIAQLQKRLDLPLSTGVYGPPVKNYDHKLLAISRPKVLGDGPHSQNDSTSHARIWYSGVQYWAQGHLVKLMLNIMDLYTHSYGLPC